MNDAELLTAYVAENSEQAFRDIVERYSGMVYATCLRGLGNEHDADDASQSVFIILAQKASSIHSRNALPGWLFRTSHSVVSHMLRYKKVEKMRKMKIIDANIENREPVEHAVTREIRRCLNEAIASLNRNQQQAVAGYYLNGKSQKEVAAEMGCSEDAARKRISYALMKLRKILSKRGITASGSVIAGVFAAESVYAAPPGLAYTCHKEAMAFLAGKTAVESRSVSMSQGAMKMMVHAKIKTAVTAAVFTAMMFIGVCAAFNQLAAGDTAIDIAAPAPETNHGPLCFDWKKINEQAVKEYSKPIMPGIPGRQPFWNPFSKQFMYAPAFHFKSVQGAVHYRLTVSAYKGRKKYVFEAAEPWAPLSPIWEKLPSGWYKLKVEGLKKKSGEPIGAGKITVYGKPRKIEPPEEIEEKYFKKKLLFKGPYGETLSSSEYRKSAMRCLRLMRESSYYKRFKDKGPYKGLGSWWITKHVSACITGMTCLAEYSSDKKEKEEALSMAANAAEYLLSISFPEGNALAHTPPMSLGNKRWVKMQTPPSAGHAYLNLYNAVNDKKYLLAARRIADVYKKLQLPSGTWHYMIKPGDGTQAAKENLLPGPVIHFMDRLVMEYGCKQYEKTAEDAVKWLLENPFKTYDWKGQFDDQGVDRPPYSNHARSTPVSAALCLLKRLKGNSSFLSMADNAVRFGEDQFALWTKKPFVKEQYTCFAAVNGSLMTMIRVYRKLYEATGSDIYLAKAVSLANTLIRTQTEDGCYPTWVFKGKIDGWPNCPTGTAVHMLHFADFLKQEERKRNDG